MTCALCKTETDLQQSHIIPEFLFKGLYDELHRCQFLSTEPCEPERYIQKGLRERLLCRTCEQKLGQWEKYTSEAFVHAKGVQVEHRDKVIFMHGLDYKIFRLLQLSLLWRMSVSQLPFFKDVNLGEKHEANLRLALLNADPLEPDQYACMLVAVKIDGRFYPDWILEPWIGRDGAFKVHSVLISGIVFMFFVGACVVPKAYLPFVVNKHNQLPVMVSGIEKFPFLCEALGMFGAATNQRKIMGRGYIDNPSSRSNLSK